MSPLTKYSSCPIFHHVRRPQEVTALDPDGLLALRLMFLLLDEWDREAQR